MTCPVCGSTEVASIELSDRVPLAACGACGAAWEAETRACVHTEPCNNCAFRPGSQEKRDPYNWMQLMEAFEEDGAVFWCHKGVPFELTGEGYRFKHDVERTPEGRPRVTNAPVCAGWLAWKLGKINKKRESNREESTCRK